MAAGSPWENGYIESFHSRLRDEFLERVIFRRCGRCPSEGVMVPARYNAVRPHSSRLRDAQRIQRSLRPAEKSSPNNATNVRSHVDVQGSLPYRVDQKTGAGQHSLTWHTHTLSDGSISACCVSSAIKLRASLARSMTVAQTLLTLLRFFLIDVEPFCNSD